MHDPRAHIISAAERLFVEHGEEGTSLRAITREAGVNVAAIHYYFGGRDRLLEAVLDARVGPLNARRLDLLDELPADAPVARLLDAFVRPDLELIDELRREGRVELARFMGRAYTQPSRAVATFVSQQFAPLAHALLPRLGRALPGLGPDELRLRVDLAVRVVTTLFATAPGASDVGPLGSDDVDEQTERLVAFLAGGFAAAPTPVITMEHQP